MCFPQDDTNLTSQEIQKLSTLLGYLQSTSFESFLNEKFPGLFPEDDILSLMKLMTSRNPGKMVIVFILGPTVYSTLNGVIANLFEYYLNRDNIKFRMQKLIWTFFCAENIMLFCHSLELQSFYRALGLLRAVLTF